MADNYSKSLVDCIATIAVTTALEHDLEPQDAIDFAWFSVAQPGDAATDEDDRNRHLDEWLVENESDWRIERLHLPARHGASLYDEAKETYARRLRNLIAKAEDVDDIYR